MELKTSTQKEEMSLKIGPPFMDDEVSCEVPDCNQHWRGENNHLASAGTAMDNKREREGFRLMGHFNAMRFF